MTYLYLTGFTKQKGEELLQLFLFDSVACYGIMASRNK
jgi:hypothetical protein